jgi:hypothetical protein
VIHRVVRTRGELAASLDDQRVLEELDLDVVLVDAGQVLFCTSESTT